MSRKCLNKLCKRFTAQDECENAEMGSYDNAVGSWDNWPYYCQWTPWIQNYLCKNSKWATVDSAKCNAQTKPSCWNKPLTYHRYQESAPACPTEVGSQPSTQHWKVVCKDSNGSIVSDSKCDAGGKPYPFTRDCECVEHPWCGKFDNAIIEALVIVQAVLIMTDVLLAHDGNGIIVYVGNDKSSCLNTYWAGYKSDRQAFQIDILRIV